jgi:gas vesicle protein
VCVCVCVGVYVCVVGEWAGGWFVGGCSGGTCSTQFAPAHHTENTSAATHKHKPTRVVRTLRDKGRDGEMEKDKQCPAHTARDWDGKVIQNCGSECK